jgi:hypothetical protein
MRAHNKDSASPHAAERRIAAERRMSPSGPPADAVGLILRSSTSAVSFAALGAGTVAAVALSVVALVSLSIHRVFDGLVPLPASTPLVAGAVAAGLLMSMLRAGRMPAGVVAHAVTMGVGVVVALGVMGVGLAVASLWPSESRTPATEVTFDGTVVPALLLSDSFATAAHLEPAADDGDAAVGGWVLVVSASPAYTAVPAARMTLTVVDADGVERPGPEGSVLGEGWSQVRVVVPAVGCARVNVALSPVAGDNAGWSPRLLQVVCP